ncbi:MAG: C40 family peptidase [Ignavibacteriales bacterium]|nr:C40 family peptidase [Ignavibacteriales bacterium]
MDLNTLAAEIAENIKKTLKLDTRFVVCDYEVRTGDNRSELYFRVSSQYIADGIRSFFEKKSLAHADVQLGSVTLLSDCVVDAEAFTICNVSAAPVMASASHASEQTTQYLLGETADVIEQRGPYWTRVRLHADGYVGWLSTNQIVRCSKDDAAAWTRGKRVASKQLVTTLRAKPVGSSVPIREFVYPATLPLKSRRGTWISLRLPDSSTGWIRAAECVAVNGPGIPTAEAILKTAHRFLGVSYLWGGRSGKGLDCSGFTQMVFRLHGIELPRDASLQYTCGTQMIGKQSECGAGDLVFFSLDRKKITHVGIALGMNREYIHASGFVKINSFDPAHDLFDGHRAETFIGARRLDIG